MHPSSYLSLFPAFPQDQRAFVAMSFAPEFTARWENVITPAVRSLEEHVKLLREGLDLLRQLAGKPHANE